MTPTAYYLSNFQIFSKTNSFLKNVSNALDSKKGKLVNYIFEESALSALRQFLTTESPLKMIKNASYFTSKTLFVLKIFMFLS